MNCVVQSAKIILVHTKCVIIFVALKMSIFCNIAIEILDLSLFIPLSYRSFNFAIGNNATIKIFIIIFFFNFLHWFIASFLHSTFYSYRFFNCSDSNSCTSFSLIKAMANDKLREKERQLQRQQSKRSKKQIPNMKQTCLRVKKL